MNIIKWVFNSKYRYFRKKLKGVRCTVLDLEFKKFKTREIREEIRLEYDNQKSKLSVVETQIKGQKKSDAICEIHNQEKGKEPVLKAHGKCTCEYIDNHIDVNEIERLYDQKELLNRDIDRFLEQIKRLDVEVEGSKRTSEYPDGYNGVVQQVESLKELESMIIDYAKSL